MEYIATYHTDVGTRKETNQDSLAIKVVNTKEGNVAFAIVCDGMGGLAKGEVASKEVIEAFCTWFDDTLVDEIQNGTFTEQNLVSQWDDIIQIQNRRRSRHNHALQGDHPLLPAHRSLHRQYLQSPLHAQAVMK